MGMGNSNQFVYVMELFLMESIHSHLESIQNFVDDVMYMTDHKVDWDDFSKEEMERLLKYCDMCQSELNLLKHELKEAYQYF